MTHVLDRRLGFEHLFGDFKVTPLTNDGSRYIVNGTFDWVYEEELFCRDGFRWSPDSRQIAYWQLNSEGVKEMHLVNNTAALYPETQNAYCQRGAIRSRTGTISSHAVQVRENNG